MHGYVLLGLFCFLCLAGLLWKARHSIQGYWFDNYCPVHCAEKNLVGRVALVTGCTAGSLGCAAAEHLARHGARVVITCRTAEKAEEAVRRIARVSPGGQDGVAKLLVDFKCRESIRCAAAKFIEEVGRLDILVLNAGVATGESADVMWQVNHVGPFMFTELLRPLLMTAATERGDCRVVAVSSGAHKRSWIAEDPYAPPRGGAFSGPYGQSKIAQIMHMRELQRRVRAQLPSCVKESSFRCFAVTPGLVATNLMNAALKQRPVFKRVIARMLLPFLARSPEVAAEVIRMACVDDTLAGGEYLSNCYVKVAQGKDDCTNRETEWVRCWDITRRCMHDGRF